MSLALYRKYRPGSFAEVRGQEHVTAPLQQALRNGRVHHAYLFSGPRGCGKTSSARIMARSLNCVQGPTPEPCGVCDSCVELAPNGPGSLDVLEIDAASHNGVDDARDLREKAFFAPVSARFKVYIIDEAHMVTPSAFNALLKLVEEPPEFVKFIFATTEPEKVLQTIRSRTHHYPFRLMPRRDLTALLQEVVVAEGIAVDGHVVPLVVRAAAGSARDGLSILDQVLASAGEDGVSREAAAGLLGVTPDVLLDDVLDAFAVGDAAAVFGAVDSVMEGGHDPRRFAVDVLERLRDLVILDAVPDAGSKGVLDCPAEQLERMARQVAAFGAAGLSRAADLFAQGLTDMRGTTAPRLQLELLCARVLLPTASSDAVVSRVERLERRFEIGAPAPVPATPPHAASAPRPAAPDSPATTGGQRPEAPAAAGGQRPEAPAAAGGQRPETPAAAGGQRPEAPAASGGQRPGRAASPGRAGASGEGPPGWRPPATPADAASPAAPAPDRERPPAPAGSDWPTAARPGDGAAPVPAAAAAPVSSSGAPGPGGLDAAEVRRAWDEVLQKVKESKRVTHARLSETTVAALDGTRLSVSFPTPTLARQFSEGVHVEVLQEALRQVLGADFAVVCVSGAAGPPAAGGARSAARPAPAAPPPAPVHDAQPDDAELPSERGEDAALRLVEQALGGRVVGTIGD